MTMPEENRRSVENNALISKIWEKIRGVLAILAACLLMADQLTDGFSCYDFYEKSLQKNGNKTNIFWTEFVYINAYSTSETVVQEAIYFYLSMIFMLLPMVIATLCLLVYLGYVYSSDIKQGIKRCFSCICCHTGVVNCIGTSISLIMFPLTFVFCLLFSSFLVVFGWVVNPFLQIIFAFFIFFGSKPGGENSRGPNSLHWKRYAAFTMFLALIETFFEAFPQSVLNIVYIFNQWRQGTLMWRWNFDENAQIVSLTFSMMMFVKSIGVLVYNIMYDYSNSIIGVVNSLRKGNEERKRRKQQQCNIEEASNLLSSLEDYGNFATTLSITGFGVTDDDSVTSVEVIQKCLLNIGFPSEKLTDFPNVTYNFNNCIFKNMSLRECMKYMKKLKDSELQLQCHTTLEIVNEDCVGEERTAEQLDTNEETLELISVEEKDHTSLKIVNEDFVGEEKTAEQLDTNEETLELISVEKKDQPT